MIYLEIASDSPYNAGQFEQEQYQDRGHDLDTCFLVLAEFSEIHGPIALKVVPSNFDKAVEEEISNFIVQVMAVDYTGTHAGVPMYNPADSSLLLQLTGKVSAFVHYFTLHDVQARGYARIFTLSYITTYHKILLNNISEIQRGFESMARVCHLSNRHMFYQELQEKAAQLQDCDVQDSSIQWWISQIEKQHGLTWDTKKEEPSSKSTVDLPQTGGVSAGRKRRLYKSLPEINVLRTIETYSKDSPTQNTRGNKQLRTLEGMCPIAYSFLQQTLNQLYTSRGLNSRILLKPRHVPSLQLGKYNIQFPVPKFIPGRPVDVMKDYIQLDDMKTHLDVQTVGDSTFYTSTTGVFNDSCLDIQCVDCDQRFVNLADPTPEEHAIRSSSPYAVLAPPLTSTFQEDAPQFFSESDKVNCCSPDTIQMDLGIFRGILGGHTVDCIYTVLCGRPMVIVGADSASCSFKNALSLFVTRPNGVCAELKNRLCLVDLTMYTIIQCTSTRDTIKNVECFVQSGLCSVIRHDKRAGRAPRYKGRLITKLWGTRNDLPQFGSGTLLYMVRSALFSELGTSLLVRYYSALHNTECEVDLRYEASAAGEAHICDTHILKYQLLNVLNPARPFLASSHAISHDFKYY